MQWLVFGILSALVVAGVRRMMREAEELSRDEKPTMREEPAAGFSQAASSNVTALPPAHETAECPTCHAFVVKGATACGRPDCPLPRATDSLPDRGGANE